MPTAHPYYRVSTDDQTVEQQRSTVTAYHQFALAPKDYALGQGHADEGVSGDVPFLDRPAGHRCAMAAQAGDCIIALKLDRAFRNTRDCLTTVDVLAARGVTMHLLDVPVHDLGTAVGRLCLTMVAAFAEFERGRMSERMREYARMRKERGDPWGYHSSRHPYGFRVVRRSTGKGTVRVMVPDPDQRELGRAIILWRDRDKMPWRTIWAKLRLLNFQQQRRKSPHSSPEPLIKCHDTVRQIYFAELRLQATEARNGACDGAEKGVESPPIGPGGPIAAQPESTLPPADQPPPGLPGE